MNTSTNAFLKASIQKLSLLLMIGLFYVSVNAQNIDLELSLSVDTDILEIYEYNTFTIRVENKGPNTATGVKANFPLPSGFVFSETSSSAYSAYSGNWTIGNISAGSSATLSVTLFALDQNGPKTAFAQIIEANQNDTDSSPDNNNGTSPNEDDEAAVSISTDGGENTGGSGNGNVSFSNFPDDQQLFPRNLSTNRGTANVSGTVSDGNDYNRIRIKLYRNNVLQNTINRNLNYSNGQANFNINVGINAERANYTVEAYGVTSNGSETFLRESENVVAGDVYVINGQSNALASASIYSGDNDNFLRSYTNNNGWNFINLSFPGQWGGRMAKQITNNENIPVALFNQAVGGQEIEYFQPGNSSNYNDLLNRLNAADVRNNIRAFLWYQGEQDSYTSNVTAYKNSFQQLYNKWESDYNPEKYYIFQVRYQSCNSTLPDIFEAQRQLANEINGLEIMSTTNSSNDGCHFPYFNGYQVLGDRIYKMIDRDLYNGTSSNVEPPNIQSASITGTTEITIQMRNTADALKIIGNPWSDFRIEGSSAYAFNGSVNGSKLILQLSGNPSGATGLTYLGHIGSNVKWVANQGNVGMVTFHNFPLGGTTPQSADLSLTMTSSTTQASQNDNISFTLRVQNNGPNNATNVTVTDLLPSGLSYLNSTGLGNYNSSSGIWTVGTLNNGATKTLTINARVNNINGSITNFAQVRTSNLTDPDSTPNNDSNNNANEDDEAARTITAEPTGGGNGADLELTMSTATNSKLEQYEYLTVAVQVKNTGTTTATGVEVRNAIPNGMAYSGDTNTSQGDYQSWNGKWDIGSLTPNAIATLNLELFALQDANPIINFAQVQISDQSDPDSTPGNNNGTTPNEDDEAAITFDINGNSSDGGGGCTDNDNDGVCAADDCNDNNANLPTTPGTSCNDGNSNTSNDLIQPDGCTCSGTTSSSGNGVDLEIDLEVDSPTFGIYTHSIFTVTISNTGTQNASGVELSIPTPNGMAFSNSTLSQGSYYDWIGQWNVGSLAAGATATLEIDFFTLTNNDLTVFAQISALNQNDIDSSPDNNNGTTPNEDDEAVITISSSQQRLGQQIDIYRSIVVSKLFPNPATNRINLEFFVKENLQTALQIYNVTGRMMSNKEIELNEGINRINLDINEFPGGMYYILIQTGNTHEAVQFTKLRM